MEAVREIAIQLTKPISYFAGSLLMTALPYLDSLNELLGVKGDYEIIKAIIAVVGFAFFFLKAIMIAIKTLEEKKLANEATQLANDAMEIDNKRKAWEFEQEQKRAAEEGERNGIEEIKELLLQTIKNQKQ